MTRQLTQSIGEFRMILDQMSMMEDHMRRLALNLAGQSPDASTAPVGRDRPEPVSSSAFEELSILVDKMYERISSIQGHVTWLEATSGMDENMAKSQAIGVGSRNTLG